MTHKYFKHVAAMALLLCLATLRGEPVMAQEASTTTAKPSTLIMFPVEAY